MPDSDSDTSAEEIDLEGINWADYPLSPTSARTVEISSAILELRERFNELSRSVAQGSSIAARDADFVLRSAYESSITLAGLSTRLVYSGEAQATASVPMAMPTVPTKKDPKQPAVTLVTALPPTSYSEQDEADGTVRTLAYVKVQRAVLKYLDKYASDTLTEAQAHKWTQYIDPDGHKKPTAVDALKLCYYMRSQGFDVYASVKDSMIFLYVIQELEVSVLYWAQNIVTNRILTEDREAPRATRGRRNAAVMTADHIGGPPQSAPAGPQSARNTDLIAAEANLQALLEEEESNPDEIANAIQMVEALRGQLTMGQTARSLPVIQEGSAAPAITADTPAATPANTPAAISSETPAATPEDSEA